MVPCGRGAVFLRWPQRKSERIKETRRGTKNARSGSLAVKDRDQFWSIIVVLILCAILCACQASPVGCDPAKCGSNQSDGRSNVPNPPAGGTIGPNDSGVSTVESRDGCASYPSLCVDPKDPDQSRNASGGAGIGNEIGASTGISLEDILEGKPLGGENNEVRRLEDILRYVPKSDGGEAAKFIRDPLGSLFPGSRGGGGGEERSTDPERDDLQKYIDNAVASLHQANIAFDTPRTIRLHKSVDLTVLLSFDESKTILKGQLGGAPGTTDSAAIQAGPEMEATLIGSSGLTVTPLQSSPVQAISSQGATAWKWRVEGISGGAQVLTLSMSAVFSRAPGMPRRSIQTFTHDLRVEVTRPEQVREFVMGNWQWLWTVFVVPIAGILWKRFKHNGTREIAVTTERPWRRAARLRGRSG